MPRTRREWKTFPINIRELTVSRIEDHAPGFRRLTLTGAQLGSFTTPDGIEVPPLRTEGFDDHVKVIVPGLGQTRAIPPRQVEGHLDWTDSSPGKDYTPRVWDPDGGRLVLDFVRHGTGFASSWVERVAVGDPAFVAGPKSSLLLPEGVDWMLVAGDETAQPAVARLLEEWPAGLPGRVFLEVADAEHEVDLHVPPEVRLTWVHRGGARPGCSTVLADAVMAAPWLEGDPYCWVAGEALSIKPLRSWFRNERAVPRDCLEVTGYWRRTVAVTDDMGRPAQEQDESGEDELDHRLRSLLDLTAPLAFRAAIDSGLLTRLDAGPALLSELSPGLGLHEPTLRAFLRYLCAIELVEVPAGDPALVADGPVALAPLGALAMEDIDDIEHVATSFYAMSLDRLLATLRGGAPAPRADGRSAAEALACDDALNTAVAQCTDVETSWWAPSVVQHHDWTSYDSVRATGPGARAFRGALLDIHPELTVIVDDGPDRAGVVASLSVLERLPDAAAVAELRRITAGPVPVVLVERVLETHEPVHDHDAEEDLRLRVAFGSGRRTIAEIDALLGRAGASVRRRAVDVGWETRMWVTGPPR